MREKGDHSKDIDMSIPFSLKQPGPTRKDINLANDMVGLHVTLKLFDDFDEGLVHIKK